MKLKESLKKTQEVSVASPEYRHFIEALKGRVLTARLSAASNVWRMRQLYQLCMLPAFLAQAVRELAAAIPWHHLVLLGKIKEPAALFYYLQRHQQSAKDALCRMKSTRIGRAGCTT